MISVNDLGGPTVLSRVACVSVPTAHGWTRIPERHCPAIERWKEGGVTVEQLRPDVTWTRIPDPDWPHPDGRPLLDFAPDRPTAQEGV